MLNLMSRSLNFNIMTIFNFYIVCIVISIPIFEISDFATVGAIPCNEAPSKFNHGLWKPHGVMVEEKTWSRL